jgi:putative ABC transport system permease protein
VVFSSWTLETMLRFVPTDLPRAGRISVDGPVLAFATAVSLLTGLLFGVLPAWRMSRLDPSLALRDGGRSVTGGRGQHNLHHWLVVAETAIGLILLVGAGLLIRSFAHVLQVDPGFDPRHVLTASLNLPTKAYDREKRIQFYNQLLARVAALPGVQSAAAGWPLPLSNNNIGISFEIEGRPTARGDEPDESMSIVTADFFQTMRIPILAGRAFSVRDDVKGTPVIVINERFARKYFPGESPVGKHIKVDLGDGTLKSPMREVVGIAGNVKRQKLTADVDAEYYLPYAQAVITSPTLTIRTAGDPTSLIGALRAQLAQMDRNLPLYRVATMEDSVSKAAAQSRFQTLLLVCFAGMALLLSAVGLYAVLSYMVAQRAGEIGVRMALGAQRGDVLSLIVRRGLALALTGIGVGLAAAALLTRFMAGMLFGVQPFDPLTFAAVAALLLAVSVVASSAPAWRAARLDPMETLRDQ